MHTNIGVLDRTLGEGIARAPVLRSTCEPSRQNHPAGIEASGGGEPRTGKRFGLHDVLAYFHLWLLCAAWRPTIAGQNTENLLPWEESEDGNQTVAESSNSRDMAPLGRIMVANRVEAKGNGNTGKARGRPAGKPISKSGTTKWSSGSSRRQTSRR